MYHGRDDSRGTEDGPGAKLDPSTLYIHQIGAVALGVGSGES